MVTPMLSRRRFLGTVAGTGISFGVWHCGRLFSPEPTDEEIFVQKVREAIARGDDRRAMGETMVAIGRSFVGVPYVAHTLEAPGAEHLVVNLRALDCTTFVESVLVLSRCVASGKSTFAAYREELQRVRYRNGTVDGYASRLHYFTDWVDDNIRKGVVQDVTRELGGAPFSPAIDFMSTHPESYRQLADPALLPMIRETEQHLSARQGSYIPKQRVDAIAGLLRDGDIIGITTSTKGLDIAHIGLVVTLKDEVRFLHASLAGKEVQVTPVSLGAYLQKSTNHTGIIVVRPRDARNA